MGGIFITQISATGNVISGNYIGVNITGNAAIPNTNSGIYLGTSVNDLLIGTNGDGVNDLAERNLISGNLNDGITFGFTNTATTFDVTVAGNYIGTDVSGTFAIPNNDSAVYLVGSGHRIGTNSDGVNDIAERNLLSGNHQSGVTLALSGSPPINANNLVAGNYIGTQADGVSPLGNGYAGVRLLGAGTNNNIIGGTMPASHNVIAFNGNSAVVTAKAGILNLTGGPGNAFLGNAIFSNTGLGIDLGAAGLTANDPDDTDTGSNQLQNYPVLTDVSSAGVISGSLNSTVVAAAYPVRIEFFANSICDPSGQGEGEVFLGAISVNGPGIFTTPPFMFPSGKPSITATATDNNGNTSEFSACICAPITLNPVTPAAICSGATTNIALTGTAGASFSWTIGPVTGNVMGQAAGSGATIAQTLTGNGSVTYIVTPTLNGCSGLPVTITQTINTAPTMTTQPASQIVGQNATATFTAAASGSPAPSVQWQVDTGAGFNDIPGATNATLTVPNVTLAMNGNRYRAVFTNPCGMATSDAALLTVNGIKVELGDPLLCLTADGLVGVTVTITNNNAAPVNANFTATLPTTLNGLPGTGLSSIMPGAVNVTAAAVTWMGVIPANTAVTITYKAQVAAGTPANMPICVDSEVTFNGGPKAVVQECKTLGCPVNGVVKVSDQKPGAVLVFPYYVSKAAEKKDTRITISNISAQPLTAHVFFIDGTTCQPADQFLCLSPFASYAFKASELDPEAIGWLLVVAVDANGRPTQQNSLIGNAFVNDGEYVDNYGAEAFKANSTLLASFTTDTATLFFDNQSYDAVPNQFAMEIQSPLDAPNQRVVMVGLQGDLTQSTVRGAAQIGPGLIINGNEKPLGSFVSWLNGNCQAQAIINASSPRVPGTMSGMIPKGQVGTMQFRIGGGVGLLMTPRTATWRGIRTLHKVGSTATTLTIPLIAPVC